MSDTYVCSKCRGTFERGWSEEEALEEARQNWGGTPDTIPMDVICEDCHQEFMAWYQESLARLERQEPLH